MRVVKFNLALAIVFAIASFLFFMITPDENNAKAAAYHSIVFEDEVEECVIYFFRDGNIVKTQKYYNPSKIDFGEEITDIVFYSIKNNHEYEIKIYGDYQKLVKQKEYDIDYKKRATVYIRKKSYKVTINLDGGQADDYEEIQWVKSGESAVMPQNVTREGFIFDGWDKSFDDIRSDVEITALYQIAPIIKHNVTFVVDGDIYNEEIDQGGQIEYEKFDWFPPQKEGHDFIHFYCGDNPLIEYKQPVAEDITLTAYFLPSYYRLSFYLPNQSLLNEYYIERGRSAENIIPPQHERYIIYGWRRQDDTEFDFAMPLTEDTDVYAHCVLACYVSFRLGEEELFRTKIPVGESVEEYTLDSQEYGYLLGWKTQADGKYFDFQTKIYEDLILMADVAWEICLVNYYVYSTNELYFSMKIAQGGLAADIEPPQSNQDFIGWQLCSDKNENFNFDNAITEDINLYAIYQSDIVTVNINLDGGQADNFFACQTIKKGKNAVVPQNVRKEGHIWIGWDKGESAFYGITQSLVITAVYEIQKFTVKFFIDNTKGILINKEACLHQALSFDVNYNAAIWDFAQIDEYDENKLNDVNYKGFMLKEGHEFLYWHEQGKSTAFDINTLVVSDINLYAKTKIKEYNVILFHEDGRTDFIVEHGLQIVLPPDFFVEGYYYEWYEDSAFSLLCDLTTPVKRHITAYGRRLKQKFNITFTLLIEEESLNYYNHVAEYEDIINPPQEIDGYSVCWFKDDMFDEIFDFSAPIKNDTQIYGYAFPKEYTVIIDLKAYGKEDLEIKIKYNRPIILEMLSIHGYTHDGKYLDDNQAPFELTVMPARDLTLYPVLSKQIFQIEFFVNDQRVNLMEAEFLEEINLPRMEDTERQWFYCWVDNEGAEYKDNKYKVVDNIVFYARYIDKNVYRVRFLHGQDLLKETFVIEGNQVEEFMGAKIEGYALEGWYGDSDYGSPFDFTSPITQDIDIYGKFNRIILKVILYADNDKIEKEIPYGESLNCRVNKEGHAFMGWYLDRDFNAKYDENVVTRDLELYARYDINIYSVTFYDGEEIIAVQNIPYGGYAHEISVDKEGYDFLGWYFCLEFQSEADVFNIPVESDLNVYADTSLRSHTVIYLLEGKQYHCQQLKYGAKAEAPIVEVEGYKPVDWYIDGDCRHPFDFANHLIKKDTVIYGKLEKLEFCVLFLGLNDKVICSQLIEYGQSATLPDSELCQEEGFVFAGFDSNNLKVYEDRQIRARYLSVKYVDMHGNVLNGSSAPAEEGYIFVGWEEEITQDSIIYKPVYQKTEKAERIYQPKVDKKALIFMAIKLLPMLAMIAFVIFMAIKTRRMRKR